MHVSMKAVISDIEEIPTGTASNTETDEELEISLQN